MDFTGERFMPEIENEELTAEHMQRYVSVLPLVKGKVVVDIASGEGYGTNILAEEATTITGLDISREAVENASKKYVRSNLKYAVGDVAKIPLEDSSVDVIVSFETIEHVDEDKQKKFLKEAKRILKDDGLLVVSTPNKELYSDKYNYHNEFHIKEFYKQEFIDFIQTEFKNYELYNQYDEVVNVIESTSSGKDALLFKHAEREGKYYIAVASNGNLPDMNQVITVRKKEEYSRCLDRIIELQQGEEERNAHIAKLDGEIAEKNVLIKQLQQGEEERNTHIKKLDGEIVQLNNSLEIKKWEINNLMENEQKREEIGKEYIATLKENIAELKGQISEKEQRIAALQENLAERNEKIAELRIEIEQHKASVTFLESNLERRTRSRNEKNQEIFDLQESIQKCNETILSQKEELFQQNVRINELQKEVEEKQALQNLLNEANMECRLLQNAMKQNEEEQKKLSEKLTQLTAENQTLQATCEEITATKQDIHNYAEKVNDEKQNLESKLSELEQELRNKQGHIELLLESDRELERLKAQQDKRLINRIFPKASKRRLFVKLAWKCVRHPFKTIKMIFTKGKVKNFFRFLKKDGVLFVDKLIDDNYRGVAVEKQELVVTKVTEAKDISEYQTLTFVKEKKPQVSIVIPVYNQFEYTYNCLKSILKNSGEITYEIIIANDCSTDLTTRISEVVKNIKVVTNKENLRFLKNCNNAAKYANGQYILFLNNDTQVQPNWLAPLVELIERDEKIGMVGSKLVYADGTLQEAGGILWKDGSAWNYGNRKDPADPEFNYVKEADYISGAAIMIKADLWNEIGGFDEAFAPAYYEDTDLAFEVRKHGYKVMYQPLSVVVHFEGVSNGTDTNSGQKAYQVVNAQKFYDKWKDVLEAEHFPNGEEVFKAKDRSRNKKHILVIDHYVPMHDKDAGNKCSFMYISLFVKLGYKVTFIGDNYYKHEPYATELNQMGVEILYGNYYYLNWQSWLKENAYNFDYVYLQRPHISIKYIDLLKTHSNAKLIYFGHDLHYLREYRQYQLEKDPALLKASNESKKREFELFNKADVIYVVGSYEQQILQQEFPNKIVRNIPVYIYDGLKEDVNTKFQTRKDIIFVGGFGHAPNKDAVLWFAEKIFPKVLKKYPDIKWYIVGSNPTEDILALNSENIIVKGFVSDEELARLYSECRMAVVPLRVGAGVKGKVVEAVYNRIPLVTTPIGAEGLSTEEKAFVVAECDDGMADVIGNLYETYNDLEQLSNNSKLFIENHFTTAVAEKIVLEDFN